MKRQKKNCFNAILFRHLSLRPRSEKILIMINGFSRFLDLKQFFKIIRKDKKKKN